MSNHERRSGAGSPHIPEILWSEDVADLLGVGVVQARRMMRSGKIPAKRVGRRWYCLRDEFLRRLRPDQEPDPS